MKRAMDAAILREEERCGMTEQEWIEKAAQVLYEQDPAAAKIVTEARDAGIEFPIALIGAVADEITRHVAHILAAKEAEVEKIRVLARSVLAMPAACTTDDEILESIKRRGELKAALKGDI